jgi:hypothetical protein
LGIAVLLATSIFSLSINTNHAKGFGFLTSAGNSTNSTEPMSHSKMTHYTDPEGRFSISYPTNWTATPATNRFQTNAATFSNGIGSAVLVQVINLASSPELAARSMTIGMYGYITFQDVECSKYKVDGNIACSFIVTKSGDVNLGTRAITVIIVVTSINNKVYTIGLGSGQDTFDSMLPTFETMVNSFRAGSNSVPNPQQQPSITYPYQQQPYQQQQPYSSPSYQQQPNNNYPLPRILSQSAYTSSTGTVHIVGEVINQSPVTAKFVKIIVTFYNAYNQVMGTDFTYTQPSDLAPGQRAPFDILVLSGGIPMNQVRNYILSVDIS